MGGDRRRRNALTCYDSFFDKSEVDEPISVYAVSLSPSLLQPFIKSSCTDFFYKEMSRILNLYMHLHPRGFCYYK